jgi:hypothetical protein
MTELLLSLGGVAVGVLLACYFSPGGFVANLKRLLGRDGGTGEEREP